MDKQNLTAERLRYLLNYDQSTGIFTRKVRTSNRIKIGDPVGTPRGCDGYLCGRVGNRLYLMHRLAWLYVHGVWPTKNLDHRNGDRSDNRIENLREADHHENGQNVVAHRDNKSGLLGVTWHRQAQGWNARIVQGGTKRSLGIHPTPELAHQAYLKAKAELHTFQPVPRDA